MERMGEQMSRCVIVGAAPFEDAACLKVHLRETDYIMAADGGLRLALAMGVTPHCVIGDFDSASMPVIPTASITQLPTQKDDTDVFAAAKKALALGYREFLMFGCLGGRFDHSLSNVFLLRYLQEHGAVGVLMDEQHEVRMLAVGTYTIPHRQGWYLSLLPYGGNACGVSIHGARYTLENADLDTAFPLGVSNEFLQTDVTVTIRSGSLLQILAKQD